MMQASFDFEGGEEFRKDIERKAKNMPGMVYGTVVQACTLIEIRAKTHHLAGATLNAQTHRLQKSVKTSVERKGLFGGEIVGRVGSPVVYAAIHEYGGIIKPKKGKYLVFQIGDKTIFTKKVTMPKRPWLSESAKDKAEAIGRLFGREVTLLIET
jgi:phage gpG-like protein